MKTYLLTSIALTACCTLGCQTAIAADGIEIDHLGINNTMVKVNGPERYLMLPIQDSNDDARIDILADGKIVDVIYARLAKSKTDFTVPLDLSPYKGHNVVLNVVTSQGRTSVREASGDACWKDMVLTDTFDTSNREALRPLFHHTPAYGWMNDPNGMFYKDGVWHLYYQWNPYGSKWQNMTWGHSTSTDLVNWEHHGIAIAPDGLGTIFSGSAAVDTVNSFGLGSDAVVAMYTAAAETQRQSLATSTDGGYTFTKYPGNPVLTLESEARDPKIFYHRPTGQWIMALAHALDKEMLFFASKDLKEWQQLSSFGKGIAAQDGVWECPDLFELTAPDGTSKWVLLCNINPGGPFGGSATQYFVGDFDGIRFTADTDSAGNVETRWLDHGKDHYATVTWSDAPDGRRVALGWMSNWQYAAEVPTLQYRSANTLPRDLRLFSDDGKWYVASSPSPEVKALAGKPLTKNASFGVSAKGRSFALPVANDGICVISLDIDPRDSQPVTLTLSNPAGESVAMTYDPATATFAMDRTHSGRSDFSQDFPATTVAPTYNKGGRLRLDLYIDRSSIEAFGDDGHFAMTNTVFPEAPYTTLRVSGNKGRVSGLNICPIELKH